MSSATKSAVTNPKKDIFKQPALYAIYFILYTLCMLYIWQHIPQYINPIAFNIGPIQIAWYGIMYLVAFAVVYYFVRYRIQRDNLGISLETVQDFFPWAIVGLLLGARLGDVFIYDWSYFQNHLSQIFLPFDIHNNWQYIGIYGMSYFGGLVGLIITFVIFSFLLFRSVSLSAAWEISRTGNSGAE
ncbi:MAG: Prolipoprotein diacylglyceryl transferase [Candidatus Moranbacteria bacterium GW2011_GWF1_44_4]|nr:MAG: Prolipoprotein diacylglyceryl transferase [Candidatus Moranbacteria bacterium GW2011_GWF1_44_4]